MKSSESFINKKYGMLTIIGIAEPYIVPSNGKKRTVFDCLCDCGKSIKVRRSSIVSGHTKSCGCNKSNITSQRMTIHGLRSHKLYVVWLNMKKRCFDANSKFYHNYGGRGITVCKRWEKDFKAFYDWAISNGWGNNLQIDRIDNDGNYNPNNCRFVTPRKNVLNQRLLKTSNTSGYVGVSFDNECRKFSSTIQVNKKQIFLGYFVNPKNAAIARNKYIIDNSLEKDYKIQEIL